MSTRILLRRDTSANWASNNPVLAKGEPGLDTDTNTLKVGDGSTPWSVLSAVVTEGGTSPSAPTTDLGSSTSVLSVSEAAPAVQRWWQSGDADWTAAIGRALGAGVTKVRVPARSTVYGVSATSTIPAGVDVEIEKGATVKATSTIAGAVFDTAVGTRHSEARFDCFGIIDCNNLAQTGYFPRWFNDLKVGHLDIRNAAGDAFIAGDPSATGVSYGLRVADMYIYTASGGRAVPAGSRGLWLRYCSDTIVNQGTVVGQDIGVRAESQAGDTKLYGVHVWGYQGAQPTTCFDDASYDGITYFGCIADTPTTYMWKIGAAGIPTFLGCEGFNNGIFGSDNVVTGVYLAGTNQQFLWVGGWLDGATASNRLAHDFQGFGGGVAAGTYIPAKQSQHVVTLANPSGQTNSMANLRLAGQLRMLGTGAILNVGDSAGNVYLGHNTSNKETSFPNGATARGYSDNFATTTWEIESSSGVGAFRSSLSPTGCVAETAKRNAAMSSITPLTSGTLYLVGVELPKGVVVNNISFVAGSTALATPTHMWFGLYDNNRNQLAVTADQGSGATWTAFAEKKLPIATVASGAATSFTTTYTGLHYIGIMVAATTPPSLQGTAPGTAVQGLTPVLYGNSDTAQTTPPAFSHTAGAMTAVNGCAYAYLS